MLVLWDITGQGENPASVPSVDLQKFLDWALLLPDRHPNEKHRQQQSSGFSFHSQNGSASSSSPQTNRKTGASVSSEEKRPSIVLKIMGHGNHNIHSSNLHLHPSANLLDWSFSSIHPKDPISTPFLLAVMEWLLGITTTETQKKVMGAELNQTPRKSVLIILSSSSSHQKEMSSETDETRWLSSLAQILSRNDISLTVITSSPSSPLSSTFSKHPELSGHFCIESSRSFETFVLTSDTVRPDFDLDESKLLSPFILATSSSSSSSSSSPSSSAEVSFTETPMAADRPVQVTGTVTISGKKQIVTSTRSHSLPTLNGNKQKPHGGKPGLKQRSPSEQYTDSHSFYPPAASSASPSGSSPHDTSSPISDPYMYSLFYSSQASTFYPPPHPSSSFGYAPPSGSFLPTNNPGSPQTETNRKVIIAKSPKQNASDDAPSHSNPGSGSGSFKSPNGAFSPPQSHHQSSPLSIPTPSKGSQSKAKSPNQRHSDLGYFPPPGPSTPLMNVPYGSSKDPQWDYHHLQQQQQQQQQQMGYQSMDPQEMMAHPSYYNPHAFPYGASPSPVPNGHFPNYLYHPNANGSMPPTSGSTFHQPHNPSSHHHHHHPSSSIHLSSSPSGHPSSSSILPVPSPQLGPPNTPGPNPGQQSMANKPFRENTKRVMVLLPEALKTLRLDMLKPFEQVVQARVRQLNCITPFNDNSSSPPNAIDSNLHLHHRSQSPPSSSSIMVPGTEPKLSFKLKYWNDVLNEAQQQGFSVVNTPIGKMIYGPENEFCGVDPRHPQTQFETYVWDSLQAFLVSIHPMTFSLRYQFVIFLKHHAPLQIRSLPFGIISELVESAISRNLLSRIGPKTIATVLFPPAYSSSHCVVSPLPLSPSTSPYTSPPSKALSGDPKSLVNALSLTSDDNDNKNEDKTIISNNNNNQIGEPTSKATANEKLYSARGSAPVVVLPHQLVDPVQKLLFIFSTLLTKWPLPTYVTIDFPSNASNVQGSSQSFKVACIIGDQVLSKANGSTKIEAHQNAAASALAPGSGLFRLLETRVPFHSLLSKAITLISEYSPASGMAAGGVNPLEKIPQQELQQVLLNVPSWISQSDHLTPQRPNDSQSSSSSSSTSSLMLTGKQTIRSAIIKDMNDPQNDLLNWFFIAGLVRSLYENPLNPDLLVLTINVIERLMQSGKYFLVPSLLTALTNNTHIMHFHQMVYESILPSRSIGHIVTQLEDWMGSSESHEQLQLPGSEISGETRMIDHFPGLSDLHLKILFVEANGSFISNFLLKRFAENRLQIFAECTKSLWSICSSSGQTCLLNILAQLSHDNMAFQEIEIIRFVFDTFLANYLSLLSFETSYQHFPHRSSSPARAPSPSPSSSSSSSSSTAPSWTSPSPSPTPSPTASPSTSSSNLQTPSMTANSLLPPNLTSLLPLPKLSLQEKDLRLAERLYSAWEIFQHHTSGTQLVLDAEKMAIFAEIFDVFQTRSHLDRASRVRSVTFTWRHGGSVVKIAGSFNDWTEYISMPKVSSNPSYHQITLHIPPGAQQYKFIVDGEWMCDSDSIVVVEPISGYLNNYCFIE